MMKKYRNKKTGFEVEAEVYEEGKEDFWADRITGKKSSHRIDDNSIPYMKVHSGGFIMDRKVDNRSIIVYNKKI